uniref:Uncharacterized protein n=1 Tax=Panstrongylus lignarius TaxID=156445 RepID=A0A224Y3X5_9HEMI
MYLIIRLFLGHLMSRNYYSFISTFITIFGIASATISTIPIISSSVSITILVIFAIIMIMTMVRIKFSRQFIIFV